jgi:hypothetical protein
MEQFVTAKIERDSLLSSLKVAETTFSNDHTEACAAMEESITVAMKKHRKGMFWWRRDRTRDEASNFLHRHYAWWEEYDEARAAKKRLDRVRALMEIANGESMSDIRLAEADLKMLQAFL